MIEYQGCTDGIAARMGHGLDIWYHVPAVEIVNEVDYTHGEFCRDTFL